MKNSASEPEGVHGANFTPIFLSNSGLKTAFRQKNVKPEK